MFFVLRPSPEKIQRVLESQRDLPVSYSSIGMTRHGEASGYPLNHHRIRLGNGSETYSRAVAAVCSWSMYDMGWTHVFPRDVPVEEGQVFAVVARSLGLWSVNPCRIVYVEEGTKGPVRIWAFAIGTLPAHSEQGEERFRVEWDEQAGDVHFEILALARPRHWMAWLGYPYVRLLLHRFGREGVHAVESKTRRGFQDWPGPS